MAKKKTRKLKYELTRHQLSRQQKQKKRQRLFLIIGISVIATVGGIIGGGWFLNEYRPLQENVIRVNDTQFNMGHYVGILEIQGGFYTQIYGPGQAALYAQSLADEVERFIQEGELIKQAAADLGVVVSDQESKDALKEAELPTEANYREIMRQELLTTKILDEHFELAVPQTAEQSQVMAMFLESESQAATTRARLLGGEDFVTLATELSLNENSPNGDGDFGWHPPGILTERTGLAILDDYAASAGVSVLSQPLVDEDRTKEVGYWLAELVGKDQDAQGELFKVQVMVLGSEEEALAIRARLEGGEDFAALAEEYSQHEASKNDGGDLGWLNPDEIYAPLEEFILGFEEGALSEPVKDDTVVTNGGYWLVTLAGREDNRQISDDDRDFLKFKAFNEWVTSLWADPANEIESYLSYDEKAWAVERALGVSADAAAPEPALPIPVE